MPTFPFNDAMHYRQPVDAVLVELGTAARRGLTVAEATELLARRQ